MQKRTDYHIHPDFSPDADKVKIRDYCHRALALQIEEICFTTHFEFNRPYFSFPPDWLDNYFAEIGQAQAEFTQQGLRIKAGIEIGYQRGCEKEIENIVTQHPFDYVLGAIHHMAGYSIASLAESPGYFGSRDLKTVRQEYFALLAEAVKSGLFDAIAHLDIYTRYGIRHFGNDILTIHRGIVEPILQEMAKRNMGLEINTSSLSRGLKEFHPSKEVIALAKKAGIKIFTVGSDAHKLEELGRHIDEALALLDEFGLVNHVFTRHVASLSGPPSP
ncbi:MAG: histidinol-phosphatase [Firmicutes bacterium]|nr:histidinol-phosphatase [Bacillota bacterium]